MSGRPTKGDIVKQDPKAEAQTLLRKVYRPPRKPKWNKPKNPKRIGPLRSSLPRASNTSAARATAVGHNVRSRTPEDSSSDREAFSDSNGEVTGHSDKHSDTSYDDSTTPPSLTEQSVISAVARRLVDGWVS